MQIKLSGKEYDIKYPFLACREIEKVAGSCITRFISDISSSASDGDVSFNDIVILVWGGILHARRGISIEQVALWLENAEPSLSKILVGCVEELQTSINAKLQFEEAEDDSKN